MTLKTRINNASGTPFYPTYMQTFIITVSNSCADNFIVPIIPVP